MDKPNYISVSLFLDNLDRGVPWDLLEKNKTYTVQLCGGQVSATVFIDSATVARAVADAFLAVAHAIEGNVKAPAVTTAAENAMEVKP